MSKKKPAQLSGGMQQRVALARAIVNRPDVLLLDEPLGALDLKLRRQMQIELKRIQTEVGLTFVHVTHDQEEAMTMADTIAVMNAGRIEQLGSPAELYENPATTFVANFLGQSNLLVRSTKDVGDDTRVFNGVDLTVNVRGARGFTFSGGTSTGKVVNDYCAIRAAVPENAGAAGGAGYLLNPYCRVESPVQTALRGLATYTIPRIDVLVSSVLQDKPSVGTDQLVSLLANYTLSPADQAAAAAQIGRPLTTTGAITVNLIAPGDVYGPRIRQLDLSAKKIIRLGGRRLTLGADFYNVANNNVTIAFNPTFVPNVAGWQSPTTYMNPRVVRLNAEFSW